MYIYITAILEHCCILEGYKLMMLIKQMLWQNLEAVFSASGLSHCLSFSWKSPVNWYRWSVHGDSQNGLVWFFGKSCCRASSSSATCTQAPGKMFPGSVSFRQRQQLRHAAPPHITPIHTHTHTPAPPDPALSHCFTCTVGGSVDCFVTVRCMPKFR